MSTIRLTVEQYIAHQKRVKGIPADQPLETVRIGAPAKKKPKRDNARELAKQIKAAGLPAPILEYAFSAQLEGSGRGWRFDLCWKDMWLAVEIDGAVHRTKERFKSDLPKQQEAFALGYKLLRVSPEQVRNGEALELVRKALT